MSTSWIHPAERTFVETLPTLTKKGANRIKTHKAHLGLCDVCLEVTWVVGLTIRGVPCRMTPGCPGRHRRDGIDHRSKENT